MLGSLLFSEITWHDFCPSKYFYSMLKCGGRKVSLLHFYKILFTLLIYFMFMKTIKFLFPVLLLSLTVGLNSCSNEDPEDLILGTWVYDSHSFDIRTSSPIVTAAIRDLFELDMEGFEAVSMTFNADGTVVVKDVDGDTETSSYKFEGGKLVVDDQAIGYTLDKNKLSLEAIILDAEELAEMGEYFGVTIQKIAVVLKLKKK